ncbi:diaminopimelate epimerase [Saccharospirillum alexandrii]|uniref:diaminopimelate epimerase n=1 Tax=Saccharospirillum alexandrii TaxID=2448477 RepID=UPI000FDCCF41|nr:diaminopimelate epimerase [Saccharospirillum alexandrii]
MRLKFTKMHGLGNDFMVIDGVTQPVDFKAADIERWADRHMGIGFDQLLLVEPPTRPDRDFRYRIFNADGTEVENCGNGARCFARFVVDHQLIHAERIRVETAGGDLELILHADGQVTVDMGRPRLSPDRIPFEADNRANLYPVTLNDGSEISLAAVNMGNPHCVIRVDNVDTAPVDTLGPELESHARFPQRVNVGFLQVIDTHNARLRVFERGVGETLACGTGACAAMVAGVINQWFQDHVRITLPGGTLLIEWSGEGNVLMTGPVETVYEGVIG